jgi:enterochelin esterase-like enzyme
MGTDLNAYLLNAYLVAIDNLLQVLRSRSVASQSIEEFKNKRLPIRFYMEVGIYDLGAAMLGSNRELRDVLQLKGYAVEYHEFAGAHKSVNWRGSFADGLISLLGGNRK